MFNYTAARESRINAGRNLTETAAAMGVSVSTLSRYERGEGEPSFSQGMALVALLNLHPFDLLKVTDGAVA